MIEILPVATYTAERNQIIIPSYCTVDYYSRPEPHAHESKGNRGFGPEGGDDNWSIPT